MLVILNFGYIINNSGLNISRVRCIWFVCKISEPVSSSLIRSIPSGSCDIDVTLYRNESIDMFIIIVLDESGQWIYWITHTCIRNLYIVTLQYWWWHSGKYWRTPLYAQIQGWTPARICCCPLFGVFCWKVVCESGFESDVHWLYILAH